MPRTALAAVRGYYYHFINSMQGTALGATTTTKL